MVDDAKVVTSNKTSDLLSLWDKDDAISRRLRHVSIDKPMFEENITININFQQNIQN